MWGWGRAKSVGLGIVMFACINSVYRHACILHVPHAPVPAPCMGTHPCMGVHALGCTCPGQLAGVVLSPAGVHRSIANTVLDSYAAHSA